MSKIKLACETYTWVMPGGNKYAGKLDHIMGICQKAGFAGIEPDASFMDNHKDPVKLKEDLDRHGLEFTALAYVEDWLHPKETDEERQSADAWIEYLQHFPDTIFLNVQMPQSDRENLRQRQDNMISCVNALSRRAAEKGIICSNHPNSPEGSVFRIAADYEVLLDGLDLQACGYCPDVGHIAKGDMNPMDILRKYRDTINLVHYKDMHSNGEWAATGEGDLDFVEITKYLVETGYEGWIVMEDECDEAINNPDWLTIRDGVYIMNEITPLLV